MIDTPRIQSNRPRIVSPSADRRRGGALTPLAPDGGSPKKVVRHDPFDLHTAVYRLSLLLDRDDGAPPENVPRRGYYLNILV